METRVRSFEEFVLADPEGRNWELHDGQILEKPSMSAQHNGAFAYLGAQLIHQLDRRTYRVRINGGHLRRLESTYFIPDVAVIPTDVELAQRRGPGHLEVYTDPLPLVVEIWSTSTGRYDVNTKTPEYQPRGDLEIWRLQPFERILTAWRRLPDGSDDIATFVGGTVQPVALPNVTIDLDALFD